MENLAETILSKGVLARVGKRHRLTGGVVRVLGAIALLGESGTLANYENVRRVLGIQDIRATWDAVQVLVDTGHVSRYRRGEQTGRSRTSVRLEPKGALLVEEVGRAMREAKQEARGLVGAKVKRKYVRKATAKPTTANA